MKKATLGAIALTLLLGIPLDAQDLTGAWQGTLPVGSGLRLVMKMSKRDDGGWKAVLYSIDQSAAEPMPATAVTLEGSTLKISIGLVRGSYEGTLVAGGRSIAGTWTQGPKPVPLNFTRATAETAWEIPKPPLQMDPKASPKFEVATIKPHDANIPAGRYFFVRGREVSATYTTLQGLLQYAYGIHVRQVVGGPDWLDKDRFDITGVPDQEGQPNEPQKKILFQKLMADRFKLVFHHDTKELPAYVLSVGKNGPKLTKNEDGNADARGMVFGPAPGGMTVPVINATIGEFVSLMARNVLDRPLVDRTGLTDRYNFQLTWAPDETQFNGRFHNAISTDDPAPNLFTAVQEQLGLKLEATKAPVDVIVIDRAEKPSEN